jgi:hypothetical protein
MFGSPGEWQAGAEENSEAERWWVERVLNLVFEKQTRCKGASLFGKMAMI